MQKLPLNMRDRKEKSLIYIRNAEKKRDCNEEVLSASLLSTKCFNFSPSLFLDENKLQPLGRCFNIALGIMSLPFPHPLKEMQ